MVQSKRLLHHHNLIVPPPQFVHCLIDIYYRDDMRQVLLVALLDEKEVVKLPIQRSQIPLS
jgi:hypothetical protein